MLGAYKSADTTFFFLAINFFSANRGLVLGLLLLLLQSI